MNKTALVALMIVATQFTGCSQDSKPEQPKQTAQHSTPTIKTAEPTPTPPASKKFTGILLMETPLGGTRAYLKRLKTADGEFQVITSTDRRYDVAKQAEKKDALKAKINDSETHLDNLTNHLNDLFLDPNSKSNFEIDATLTRKAITEEQAELTRIEEWERTEGSAEAEITKYEGLGDTEQGVHWQLGKRYQITGRCPSTIHPLNRLDGVKDTIYATTISLLDGK
jgi:hypothetical protein